MRKSFKKAVACLAASALALTGILTFKPEVAKADDIKTMHISIVGDLPTCDGVAVQGWCGIVTSDQVAVNTLSSAWGIENETGVTVLTLDDENKADMLYSVNENDINEWIGMQLLCITSESIHTFNANFNDLNAAYTDVIKDNDEVWVTFYTTGDVPYTISGIDPDAITAEDVIGLIDAIGDVTLESESAISTAFTAVDNYLAVSDKYSIEDITNYSVLEAASAKLSELQAKALEEKEKANAAAAGKITLYVEKPESWDSVELWAWTDAGNLFDAWPGQSMTACDNNEGWYKCTFDANGVTNVIFSNAGTPQTVDITGLSAGTYWFWLYVEPTNEKYDVEEMTTEAPQDWEDEEASEIDVNDPEAGDPETGDDTETEASAWDEAGLKVHVLLPEDNEYWTQLGIYVFGTGENFGWSGGSGELTGSWPGAKMILENNSEKWYAFGGTFSDGYYDVIINNYVSDAEAADGAVKRQAKEVELTDGEYWLLIDFDQDGNPIAQVLTEAPADYDGTGLSAEDVVVEEPTEDEPTEDDNEPKPAPTADVAPYAAIFALAMASAAVVISKKRRAA